MKQNIQLPLALRVLNQTVGVLRSVGLPIIKLDKDTLMAAASARTGLTDFGDDYFQEPLAVLLWSLEHEAQLTAMGRMIVRDDFIRLLENRLHFTDILNRQPAILDEVVERPLFILGPPRTGTSINHELFAQDPENRVPMTWEVKHPFPPPEIESLLS